MIVLDCGNMCSSHTLWFSVLFLHLLVIGVLSDTCMLHSDCRSCIRDSSVCAWCAMDKYEGSDRCRLAQNLPPEWCSGFLQNVTKNVNAKPFANKKFSSTIGEVIQIRPQTFTLNLRPGVPVTFSFSYQPASDYPVDLYFLFDNSSTMYDVQNIIADQSHAIYDTMFNLTKNIQLGMGSFVDKNTLPYTNIIDSTKTYSFRNRLKLQSNYTMFRDILKNNTFGYNYDLPEGGLDALAQVLSCGNSQIGWRTESRKFVVFVTDGPYHVAGDGMMGGIFTPYDGKCYTNDDGVYTKELEMDYPSVSIINKLAADEEITIIFAVKSDAQRIYSNLNDMITGSIVETFDSGNNNIVKILTNIYKSIARKIKLKTNFKSGHRNKFEIKFDPDCTDDAKKACTVKEGEEKKIMATVKVLEYFEPDTSLDISIEGIKEKLTLDVKLIKDCECASNGVPNSEQCNKSGTRKCGTCECNKDIYGVNCACTKNSASKTNDNSTCIPPGIDQVECSGHGSCICGNCICRKNSPYEGKYCEFNKDNCPRNKNAVCSGHGRCKDEQCICSDEWEGPACECPKSEANCLSADGKVCNGRGKCECGKCLCDHTAEWDARDKHDELCHILPCDDCHKPQCDRLQSCAMCLHSQTNCSECTPFKTAIQNLITANGAWMMCPELRIRIGCYTRYMYRYSEDKYELELIVQSQEDCLESYYGYGGLALGILLLLGIAVVVGWKWITHARDRREYEEFLRENQEDLDQVCENPGYKPASTCHANPNWKPSEEQENS